MTQFEQLDLLLNEYGGIIQTFQVIDNGISKPVFYSYVKERGLDQAAHGVYVSPDTWTDAMYILHLRCSQAVFSHETALFFHDLTNREPLKYIAIAKPGASREEIMEAAKKASIHDFIMTLPKGYDTEVGELGDTLSGGEKQRIGIARAFLHECPLILLDEPTSNLDSLNEGIILKSLKESAKKKTVVLVSHRVSTMNVADVVYEMENGRIS